MADTEPAQNTEQAEQEQALESGTYEIIRNRLTAQSKDLRSRLDQLNEARKDVFGSIETELLSTERVTTEHNCVPRDMLAIGDHFLFGYNVTMGLKSETHVSDVFSVYEYKDRKFISKPLDLLNDKEFHRDFKDIYRYYKGHNIHQVFCAREFSLHGLSNGKKCW